MRPFALCWLLAALLLAAPGPHAADETAAEKAKEAARLKQEIDHCQRYVAHYEEHAKKQRAAAEAVKDDPGLKRAIQQRAKTLLALKEHFAFRQRIAETRGMKGERNISTLYTELRRKDYKAEHAVSCLHSARHCRRQQADLKKRYEGKYQGKDKEAYAKALAAAKALETFYREWARKPAEWHNLVDENALKQRALLTLERDKAFAHFEFRRRTVSHRKNLEKYKDNEFLGPAYQAMIAAEQEYRDASYQIANASVYRRKAEYGRTAASNNVNDAWEAWREHQRQAREEKKRLAEEERKRKAEEKKRQTQEKAKKSKK